MAGETEREWGSTITMSDEVKARVDSLWQDLGIDPEPQELTSLPSFSAWASQQLTANHFIIPAQAGFTGLHLPELPQHPSQFTEAQTVGLILMLAS